MQLDGNSSEPPTGCATEEAALDAALEHVPAAALLCDNAGEVVRSNEAAQRLFASDPESWSRIVARALDAETSERELSVSRLAVSGRAPHVLIVVPTRDSPVRGAVETARSAWGLTRRQAEVLRAVADGLMNREIASELGCTERTIELHVTKLLRNRRVASRSQLLVALWRLADR